MSEDLNMNSTNMIAKGIAIYEKGEKVQSVALILKGRVEVQADGVKTLLGSGNFLGMYDVKNEVHSFTYTALDDVAVYGLPISKWEQVCLLLEKKPQYRGLFVTSMNFFLRDLYKKFNKMKGDVEQIGEFLLQSYGQCNELAETIGLKSEKLMSIERLNTPEQFELPKELQYYLSASEIPLETQKQYYSGSEPVAEKHAEEQSELLPALVEGCHYYSEWLIRYFRIMISDEKNLFHYVGRMALRVRQTGEKDVILSGILDQLLAKIDDTETELIEIVGVTPELNRERMEEIYFALLSDDTGNVEAYDSDSLHVLDNSLLQIFEYGLIPQETADEFESAINDFLGMTDKFVRTPEATKIRKSISNLFFDIYEAVAKKSFTDMDTPPLAIDLFLKYGYVSEELLTEEELRTLLAQPEPGSEDTECRVYTMCQWLEAIYNREREPSKDEFDMDFEEHLRKDEQTGSITSAEAESKRSDKDARVHFEVDNLMKYADRILNGNLSAFVPVLCSEGLYTRIENSVVTGTAINAAVKQVEKVDYSIFYRTHLASYEQAEITRFSVVAKATPDFIIFPVYGQCGQMWQDVSGRDRSAPGRILLPALLDCNLQSEILRLMAHFRWERCRTEMGAEWNNYRYPSLTSEYTDYLQFYKKNNELSPEKKDKIKAQLTQCNNRHKEVFTKDYQDWILKETAGAMKLNRIAREILFTYCPPSSAIAEGLLVQNSYQEAARRYMTEKRQQEKSFTVLYRKFEKNGIPIPEEVELTKKYLLDT